MKEDFFYQPNWFKYRAKTFRHIQTWAAEHIGHSEWQQMNIAQEKEWDYFNQAKKSGLFLSVDVENHHCRAGSEQNL